MPRHVQIAHQTCSDMNRLLHVFAFRLASWLRAFGGPPTRGAGCRVYEPPSPHAKMSLDAQLVAACSSENPSWATIESLLKQGADGNASDAESLSCVWHLIYTEHVELACKFIDFCCDSREYKGRKLNLDVRDDGGEGTTYLCLACFEGLEDLAKCLIKHGAKLEERDNGVFSSMRAS